MRVNNVCYLGEIRVGAPLCAVMALKCPEIRFTVLCSSKNAIEWNTNHFPYYEPNLEDIVKQCRNRNLNFTSDFASTIKEADLIFISVSDSSTSPGENLNSVDFKQLEDVARLITANSISDKIIVQKSTLSVSAIDKINKIFKSLSVPGVNFEVISCPAFIGEGKITKNLLDPERIIIGVKNTPPNRAAGQVLKELYEHWVSPNRISIVSIPSAQIIKLVADVFLEQTLCSFYTVAQISEDLDFDASKIVRLGRKAEKCHGKGPNCWNGKLELEDINEEITKIFNLFGSANVIEGAKYWKLTLGLHFKRIIEKLNSKLSPFEGKQIGIWGFSYKKNSSETRSSLAIQICMNFLLGGAHLKVFDPVVTKAQIVNELKKEFASKSKTFDETKLCVCDNVYDTCEGSEAVVLCTEWDEFREVDFKKIVEMTKTPTFYDARRFLDVDALEAMGIKVYSATLYF